jgi:hypothetical protein
MWYFMKSMIKRLMGAAFVCFLLEGCGLMPEPPIAPRMAPDPYARKKVYEKIRQYLVDDRVGTLDPKIYAVLVGDLMDKDVKAGAALGQYRSLTKEKIEKIHAQNTKIPLECKDHLMHLSDTLPLEKMENCKSALENNRKIEHLDNAKNALLALKGAPTFTYKMDWE